MPINPKFLIATFWNAIAYIILILFLVIRNIYDLELGGLTWQVLGYFNELLLVLLFVFVVEVLRHTNEKKYIIISYSLYPIIVAVSTTIFAFFKVPMISPLVVSLGALTLLVTINLFIQSFRLKKSPIRIYCRAIAITIFVILLIKQLLPLVFSLFFNFDRAIYRAGFAWVVLVDAFLYIFVPINVLLIIRKIGRIERLEA